MKKSSSSSFSVPENLTLGQTVNYTENYKPSLLQGVPRSLSRDSINITSPLPFNGMDIWNGYELSWLNLKGKPNVAILQCFVPIDSKNLIESKSFKLYLNSFNQTQFENTEQVRITIEKDLSECAEKHVEVKILSASDFHFDSSQWKGTLIDDLDIDVSHYQPNSELLCTTNELVEETLISHLLKSNCLITHQPDWASIQIKYKGNRIVAEQLLAYIISYRQHNEFHEQCVERIFCDIMNKCKPELLSVYARYTRRGGLDINPIRTNFKHDYNNNRLARQ